jgi:hypothetical protein
MTNYFFDGIKNITLKNNVVYIDVFVENTEPGIIDISSGEGSGAANPSSGKIITSLPGALQMLGNLEGFKNKLLEANVISEGTQAQTAPKSTAAPIENKPKK